MTSATETQGFQHPGSPPTKASLTSWWDKFKGRGGSRKEDHKENPGIFGIPLQQSIKYARVAISLTDASGNSFIYGYIPIVIAKCGVFLKNKATDVEGIFRLNGSAKRIKDLQVIFNSPDKYGKNLSWDGYTVHDAANILRRYLNQLPEPIIPLEFYQEFRKPLMTAPVNTETAIAQYQGLISQLPALNRQLLLYILDLLAVFASKSDANLMPSPNLAAIFQPGLISHPEHDMSPSDYRVSQDVLVFLIDNQDHFLLGMRGQSDDVEIASRNPSTTSPAAQRKKTLERSASNASAGAESLRKQGGIRRNVSVSSKHSFGGSSPVVFQGSLSRSNTVPSKTRSPIVIGAFRASNSPLATPTGLSVNSALEKVEREMALSAPPTSASYTETQALTPASYTETHALASTPASYMETHALSPKDIDSSFGRRKSNNSTSTTTDRSFTQSRPTTPQKPLQTPTKERAFPFFSSSLSSKSLSGDEKRQSNKLKKKTKPSSSSNPSSESLASTTANGSTHALTTIPLNEIPVPPLSHPEMNQPPLMPISEPPSAPDISPLQPGATTEGQPNIVNTGSGSIIDATSQTDMKTNIAISENMHSINTPGTGETAGQISPRKMHADRSLIHNVNGQRPASNHMMVPVTSNVSHSASTSSLVPATSPALSAASSVSSQTSSHSDQPKVVEQRKHRSIWRVSTQKLNLGGSDNNQHIASLGSPPAVTPGGGLRSPPPLSGLGVPGSNNSSNNSFSLLGRSRNRSQSVDDRPAEPRAKSPPSSTIPQRGVSASGHGNSDTGPNSSGALSWLQKKINERNDRKDREVTQM